MTAPAPKVGNLSARGVPDPVPEVFHDTGASGKVSEPAGLDRRLYLVLGAVVGLGPFSIDMYLPALPEMASALGTSAGTIQMTVTAFLIGLTFGPLFFGPLSDALGRKRPIMLTLAVYSLISLLIAMVSSVELMIALRFVQAFGGGSAFALARSVVRDVLSGDALARAMSILTVIVLGAPILAPFIGGFLLLVIGWRAIFVALATLGAIMLVAVWRRLPETLPPRRRRPLDLPTSLRGYLSITRSRAALAYAVCGGAVAGILFSYLAATPFIYIEYYGLDEQWYGALFAVGVVGAWIAQFFNIRYVLRIGYRRMVLLGALLLTLLSGGLLWVTFTDFGGLAGVVTAGVLALSCMHLVTPCAHAGVLDEFPQMAGSASGFADFARFALGSAGAAAVSLFNDGTPRTFGLVVMACAVLALLSAVVAHSPTTKRFAS